MDTIDLTLSLARAHKLADRVKDRMQREQSVFRQNTDRVSLTGHAGTQQVNELKARRPRADAALRTFREWNEALRSIRTAIGRANVAAGVADLLARRDALTREVELLRPLLDERTDCIRPEELDIFKPLNDINHSNYLSVTLLAPELSDEAHARTEALKTELFQLGNALADANHERVTITLARHIAKQLGLAA